MDCNARVHLSVERPVEADREPIEHREPGHEQLLDPLVRAPPLFGGNGQAALDKVASLLTSPCSHVHFPLHPIVYGNST